MTRIAAALLVLLAAAPAAAQTVTAEKRLGTWTIRCARDGMTDRTGCQLYTQAHDMRGRPAPAWLSFGPYGDDPQAPLLAVAFPYTIDQALIRVGSDAPARMDVCPHGPTQFCTTVSSDIQRLKASLIDGARVVVRLRISFETRDDELIFTLDQTQAAVAEYRRLASAP